ncbi:hypothetical protein DFJ74DRAFT_682695 [Hyaloraphidium curvatum]|nr:hypothetical protein DFJ74DRAFT_682695 [Hyaloraphidium curvatum]
MTAPLQLLPREIVAAIAARSVDSCLECMRTQVEDPPSRGRDGPAKIKQVCAEMTNQRKVSTLFKDTIDKRWKTLMALRDLEGTFVSILQDERLFQDAIHSWFFWNLWLQVHPQRPVFSIGRLFARLRHAPIAQVEAVLTDLVTHDVRAFLPRKPDPTVGPLVARLLSDPPAPDVLRRFLGWLSDAPVLRGQVPFTNPSAVRTAADIVAILEYRIFAPKQVLAAAMRVPTQLETGTLSQLYNAFSGGIDLRGLHLPAEHLIDLLVNSPGFVRDFRGSAQLLTWLILEFVFADNGGEHETVAELLEAFPTTDYLDAARVRPEKAAETVLSAVWTAVDEQEFYDWTALERLPLLRRLADALPPTLLVPDGLLWKPGRPDVSSVLTRVFFGNASKQVRLQKKWAERDL